jgi:AraC-like DNA-binding protein
MRQAILLLTTSKRSVSEIGETVGLANSSYFCKFFKDKIGITPYQYRKKKFAERF